jgi:hypothetical protein
VQCTRAIIPSWLLTELSPFVTFPLLSFFRTITGRLMVGIQYNFMQWSSTLRGIAVYKNHNSILTPWLITELLPFVTFPCPEHNLKTAGWNSIQLHTVVKDIKRKCSTQEYTSWHLDLLQSYCPLLLFPVRSITWKLLVGIQYNFIQLSRILKGSAVHKSNNSILTKYRVNALWYFSLSGAYLKTYWLEFKTTSYNGQAQ